MAAALLGIYDYTYGVGEPNRRMEFVRQDGQDPSTIEARVYVLAGGVADPLISQVAGTDISVELASTTDKMKAMMDARKGKAYTPQEDTTLNLCQEAQQNQIFANLDKDGQWRVSTQNEPGPRYERVVKINLFNVS